MRTVKRGLLALLALLALLLLLLVMALGDDSRSYTFRLTVDGQETCRAAAGDTVTVSLVLCRTTGTGPMFAMQDEILFDPAALAYLPDSTLVREGIETSVITLRDGRQAVYMNFLSLNGGAEWSDEVVVGSFRLKVLADGGVAALCSSNYLVSTRDGMDCYTAVAEDAAVVVSDRCRVTFQTNGGSAVPAQEVLRGGVLAVPQPPVRAGYAFAGWYSDYDLTRRWDFDAPVTADMTLYAAWTPEATAPAQGLVWPAVVILLAAAGLAWYNHRRRT